MKNNLIVFFLRVIRCLAEIRQLGNPYGKSPCLEEKMEEGLATYKYASEDGEVRVWHLGPVLATALYGGALINAKNQVYDRFVWFPWGLSLHPVFSFPYIGIKKAVLNKVIYLITPEAKGNYYHWMTDLLPRLLLIKKSSLPDFQERILILHSTKKPYETDTLDLLDISIKNVVRIKTFETVEANDLVVADHHSNERSFPNWKKILLNEFKEQSVTPLLPEDHYKRVYLYRGNQKVRRLIGEDHLVKVLTERRFQMVDPQKLSLAEQIAILKQARIVVAMHGAALTNVIFCEENSCVIELRSTKNSPEHYSSIAKAYRLRMETVYLTPTRLRENRHDANKENLKLTNESLRELLSRIEEYEHILQLS